MTELILTFRFDMATTDLDEQAIVNQMDAHAGETECDYTLEVDVQ